MVEAGRVCSEGRLISSLVSKADTFPTYLEYFPFHDTDSQILQNPPKTSAVAVYIRFEEALLIRFYPLDFFEMIVFWTFLLRHNDSIGRSGMIRAYDGL